MSYEVSGSGFSWQVVDADGAPRGKPFNNNYSAQECAKRFAKQDQIRTRACLCCSNDFKSEGPHNRMCPRCRQMSEGMM